MLESEALAATVYVALWLVASVCKKAKRSDALASLAITSEPDVVTVAVPEAFAVKSIATPSNVIVTVSSVVARANLVLRSTPVIAALVTEPSFISANRLLVSLKDPVFVCVNATTFAPAVAPSADPAVAAEFVDPECALYANPNRAAKFAAVMTWPRVVDVDVAPASAAVARVRVTVSPLKVVLKLPAAAGLPPLAHLE